MTLDVDTEQSTAELADMIAGNSLVDPRSIPTRFSLLKQMALSGAHYFEAAQRPQDDSLPARLGYLSYYTEKKDALRFGLATHLILLGDPDKIAIYDGKMFAGHAYERFVKESREQGKVVIVKPHELARAGQVAMAIRRHPRAMALLFEGTVVEQRIDWHWLGRAVRSTPDARSTTHLSDLKTTVSAKPDQFTRHALRYHYHAQAALYVTCCEEHLGYTPSDFYFPTVEKARPNVVQVFRVATEMLDVGRKQIRLWMEDLLECEASNHWPGYASSDVELALPDYLRDTPAVLEIDGKLVEV